MSLTQHQNHPTAITIFGGTGDLAQTKLLPALLHLYIENALPDQFVVVGLSRKQLSDEDYQAYVKEVVSHDSHNHPAGVIDAFCEHFRYATGAFDDAHSYEVVKEKLVTFDDSLGMCTNKLFYLAVPPQYYDVIFEMLHSSRAMSLCDGEGSWSRLLVEKPFGRDVETADALERKLSNLFSDDQIYRIDHYLAKDAIENIMTLRFLNSVLTDSWHGEAIESIAIKLLETKDVSNRGSFYDALGTLRDVGQNHILQIFALLTMEKVDIMNAEAVRGARAAAVEALKAITLDHVIRGRYVGYKDTLGVAVDSDTETYFRVGFTGQSASWQGTKFSFEAGKALHASVNEAVITFKPLGLCRCGVEGIPHEHRNEMVIRFGKTHSIQLSMWMKKPGFGFSLEKQELVLTSETSVDTYSPEAYERVLFDCIAGDQTRFVSGQEVAAAWHFITPILEQFKALPLYEYEVGTVGPAGV